jgi:hypothetical protein
MLIKVYRAFLVLIFAFSIPAPAWADVYILTGQVHPRFPLDITLNGKQIKSVVPRQSKPKLFIKQLASGDVKQGVNTLAVTYQVLSRSAGGDAPVPSFKIRMVRKKDISDRSKGVRLMTLRGPGKPYEMISGPVTVQNRFIVE